MKPISKMLLKFLGLEIFTMVFVGLLFTFVKPKIVAGLIAGSLFLLLGFLIIYRLNKTGFIKKFSLYWIALVHLFLVSIPMVVVRMANLGKNFEDVKYIFLTGPEFHKLAEGVYLLLMASTIVDAIRLRKSE